MKQYFDHSSGPHKIPLQNIPKEVGSGPWGSIAGSDSCIAPNDASLFSSSLPVLTHEKLNLNGMGLGCQSIDDISSGLSENCGVAGNGPLEGIANPSVGNSLPDDEDELLAGIMDDFDLRGLPSSLEDLEDYDLFGSGGGMELEGDPQECLSTTMSKVSISDSAFGNGLPHYSVPNGAGTVAGEHPYGEHPSRTLFVRNINSNVEDLELRDLFEQYGNIRTLYTACKHRGFVMISYYDIRAARTAMRALQNKPLRRRKLDIHFSIPKDNPSDKDLNQGTLVVFNLDPSVSNEDLRQIFGAYGEVKEIRETPHKRHHKFIEFYDVRAAEAALKSLNRSDIAGKRIKLEPSRPGGARRNLMLQLNQELEQDESRILQHQVGSPITNSPPGNWMQFNSPIEHNPLQSISKSPVFRNVSPTTSNHMPGLASILNPQVPNSVKIAPIGKDQGRGSRMEHAFANTISANGASFQQSNSFPEPKIGQYHGTMSSFGPSPSNGSGVETLSGPQFLWGSPSRYSDHSSSPAWQISSMGHPFSSNGKNHGLPYSGRQGSFLGSSQHHHHHHIGSAPSGVPLERHFGFLPESPETSFMNPVAFRGMGIGQNDRSFMVNMGPRASVNPGITVPINLSENGSSSFRVMSSPRLSPVLLGNGPYPGLTPTNMEGLYERGRSRRIIENNNGNQIDSKKQFQLDLEKIKSGEDTRTTLMIKNIPNKYTSKMLLAAIDENHKGTYDFLYLPIDFKNITQTLTCRSYEPINKIILKILKMRFNFDLSEPNTDSRRSLTPKEEVEWVPLQNHPIFSDAVDGTAGASRNLVAWDGASRLYYWDPNKQCLHRISIRLGEPDPTSILAASPSKVMQADVKLNFEVNRISINRNGSALLIIGSDGLCVMYLYGRTCASDNKTIVCRTVSVGSQIYFSNSNVIRTLQVSWHPYSDTHLGIISSDSVFRLFNLASEVMQPEQEYYLQPVQPGRSRNAASICPVDFSFGGDHMWDRFSIFVLFSDGSVYILCPVVPFGSVYKSESVLEIYSDAQTFGLRSVNSSAVSNSSLAISWLEATFPEMAQERIDEGNLPTLKAHPHALFDSSVSLQGPLRKICHGGEDESLAVRGIECEGRAVSFLYNLVSKDSIVVTAWSGGQLQIDALGDEIQPVWTVGNPPRLRVDAQDRILGLAMISEPISGELPVVKLDQSLDHTVWLGHPPPLLRLATVDLALPRKTENGSIITMFADPLMQERIYAIHDGGIDSIVLHFLPFTSQISGKDETNKSPSVHPILNTCQGETSSPSPLCGFVSLSDSFGYSWIVGVTSTQECVVIEMKTWNLLLPFQIDSEKKLVDLGEKKEIDIPDMISKELLSGPKVVLLPQASPNLRSVAADSIEGRSTLHQYFKIFHENYVEYAHKVYFELKHHAPQLKRIIDDQHARLAVAQEKILKVEERQSRLEERIDHAIQRHNSLEQRLQSLRNLPGAHKKPLSRAEREFMSELGQFAGVELDALHSSIDALRARLRRFTQSPKDSTGNQQRKTLGKNYVRDAQMSQLRSSIEKLSLINSENSNKVKLVQSALKRQESSKC